MTPEWVFYDGDCGFCHRWVKFIIGIDRRAQFRFAPRVGETFRQIVPSEVRATLPPSVVVRRDDGVVLTRSDAVLHVLERLGGVWALLSRLGRLVPANFRNVVYAGVARVRHRLYPKPVGLCPIVAPELRSRFGP